LWTKLFFTKHKYNIFEILILLCFVMGIVMLIYAVFGIIRGITHLDLKFPGEIVGLIYTTWAVGQFYDKTKVASYFKAFFAYIFGMLTFALAVIIVGTLIDLITKH
jgi:tellurite resistance protein TehA-like permease